MWPRRRTKPAARDRSTPEDRLWHEIGFLFEDESGYYAGPDVGLWELAPNDVERVWTHFEACCTSFPDEPLRWTPDDTEHQPLKLPGAVSLVLAGGIEGLEMRLSGVRSQGEVLPDLFISVHRDGFSLYWWVGHPEDDWSPKEVAALVVLLAELRELVPHALLEFEWPSEAPGFWDIVAKYGV